MSAAPIKVLVIDDEPPIRKLLRMGLSTQGYQVLEAPNGKTALELLAQHPALIILDLGLPDIQGHELLRTIRGRDEGVPIVVLSSRGDEAGKVQALDLGADDYLTKPFGMDELLARLRAALRHQLQVHGERPVFVFDRDSHFGYRNALNYQIVVNWFIAEHKSQGLFQTDSGKHQLEQFWLFEASGRDASRDV